MSKARIADIMLPLSPMMVVMLARRQYAMEQLGRLDDLGAGMPGGRGEGFCLAISPLAQGPRCAGTRTDHLLADPARSGRDASSRSSGPRDLICYIIFSLAVPEEPQSINTKNNPKTTPLAKT